jgi:hypothetical protein
MRYAIRHYNSDMGGVVAEGEENELQLIRRMAFDLARTHRETMIVALDGTDYGIYHPLSKAPRP